MVVLQLQDASSIDSHDSIRASPIFTKNPVYRGEPYYSCARRPAASPLLHSAGDQEENASSPAVQRVLTIFLLVAAIKPGISSGIAACDASTFKTGTRSGSENVRRQIVFMVENADEFGLVGSVANRQTGGRWC